EANVDYMDPAGYVVNSASPSPPGVEGAAITTSEFDPHGNVVRELGARARLEALEAAKPAARSRELDRHSTYVYAENGARTVQSESWGPLHKVRLEGGETVEARAHTTTRYDEGFEHKAGETWPNLPTTETTGAFAAGSEGELESRISETAYNWSLRK